MNDEELRAASIIKLAELSHLAEDTEDDLLLMAIEAEVMRRDAQIPQAHPDLERTRTYREHRRHYLEFAVARFVTDPK